MTTNPYDPAPTVVQESAAEPMTRQRVLWNGVLLIVLSVSLFVGAPTLAGCVPSVDAFVFPVLHGIAGVSFLAGVLCGVLCDRFPDANSLNAEEASDTDDE
ncbi:MAG: hypothetical protein AAFX06_19890 [Planctomycetota bacterium]